MDLSKNPYSSQYRHDNSTRDDYHKMIELYTMNKVKEAKELAKKIKAAGDLDKGRMKDVDHILASK